MKRKKQRPNTALPLLALLLTLSAGTIFPAPGTEHPDPVPPLPKLPPVEEEIPETESSIRPLSDKDDPTTMIQK